MRIGISGSSLPVKGNYLDLDPTYKDAWGTPLLRMTFDFPDNDIRMNAFCTERAKEIAEAIGIGERKVVATPRGKPYTMTQYQSTHNTGGAVMGATPANSVHNRYQQSWDVHNLFVVGASSFPHNPAYNPTDILGALAYYAAEAITTQYVKSPGPLAHA